MEINLECGNLEKIESTKQHGITDMLSHQKKNRQLQ